MAKPNDLPEIASTTNYPHDATPEQDTATKVDPSREAYGWRPNEHPPAQELNWLFNLIYLWLFWLNGLWDTSGNLTLDANASVKITGTGRFKHGTITTFIPASAGTEQTNLAGTFDSIQGTGVINAGSWVIPIVLPVGERITAVRALVRDSVTGPTTLRLSITALPGNTLGNVTVVAATNVFTNGSGTHSLSTGDGPFQFTTTGVLPGGLALATDYWIIRTGTNTFKLASTFWNAIAGTEIDITSVGTGTHTAVDGLWGLAPSAASSGAGTDQVLTITGALHVHSGIGGSDANAFNRFVSALIDKAGGSADVRYYGIEVDHDMLD